MAGLPTQDMTWVPADFLGGPVAPAPIVPLPGIPPVDAPIANPALPEAGPGAPPPAPLDPADSFLFPPGEFYQPDLLAQPTAAPAPAPAAPGMVPDAPPAPAAAAAPGPAELGDQLFPFQAPQGLQDALLGAPPDHGVDYDFTDPEEFALGEAEALTAQGPEAVALEGEQRKIREETFAATEKRKAAIRSSQMFDEEVGAWQKRRAEWETERVSLRQEAADQAKESINNDNWWGSRTTGQKIAAYVSAIAGGLLSPYQGGRNAGLELIQQAIAQDIETQKANLAHRRDTLQTRMSGLSQAVAQSNDELRSAESIRIAAHEVAIQAIDQEAALLDPQGSAAQRLATVKLQARAAQAKAIAEAEEKLFTRKKDEHSMWVQDQQLIEQRRARGEAAAARRQAQAESRAGRVLEAKKAGLVYDAKGNLVADPAAPAGGAEYEEVFDPETGAYVKVGAQGGGWAKGLTPVEAERRLNLRAEREARQSGRAIVDTAGQYIGRSRGNETEQAATRVRLAAHADFRKTMLRLGDLIQKSNRHYKGVGTGRWPTEVQSAVDALRDDLANQLAKIRDPESVNREGEVAIAKQQIPDSDGWMEDKDPMVRYRTLVKTADDRLESYLVPALEGYDAKNKSPSLRFQSADKIMLSTAKVGAQPRETTVKELTAPISKTLDPITREAAISAHAARLDALGDRAGMTEPEFVAIKAALEQQLAAGDLSPQEYRQLDGQLNANWLIRRAKPEVTAETAAEQELFLGVK